MKIAGVTMTYNDGYKLREWVSHYKEFRKELDYYIVVDNGSEKEYLNCLKKNFSDDVIIERNINGGCTAAYNDGIKYAMEKTDADAVVIIGNDIRLSEGCISELYRYLTSDSSLGIVSTPILSIDSDILDDFGHTVNFWGIIRPCDIGSRYSDIKNQTKYTELVTGGFYMASRDYYEKVGYQDENLFMYGDEIDTSIRTKRAGFKMGVTSYVYAWHWHINQPGMRERRPASSYLISRNRVYLARKHYGFLRALIWFSFFSIIIPIRFVITGILKRQNNWEKAKYSFLGGIYGLKRDMSKNKYTEF